jgi:uncharacterized membrane protein
MASFFQNGRMTDLGLEIFPNAISNNGVVVGQGGCGNAVIVTGGICQNLQNLIPAGSGYTLQSAKGINNKGQVVVDASTTNTFQKSRSSTESELTYTEWRSSPVVPRRPSSALGRTGRGRGAKLSRGSR